MNILNNIFGKKEELKMKTNADFWAWFEKNEKTFYKVVNTHDDVELNFFDKLTEQLDKIKEGYFFLTGMLDDTTAELIITVDGNLKTIAFAEDLIKNAPLIKGWKFTALKRAHACDDFSIKMNGFEFSNENIFFYENLNKEYPDEINLTFVYAYMNDKMKSEIEQGVCIYIENFLGELEFVTQIDVFDIKGKNEAEHDLIPISKLKEFLNWREKEFNEKNEGIWYDSENDSYSSYEADLNSGNPLIAIINSDLLKWDAKASHPWMVYLIFNFDGTQTNGMPNQEDYDLMNQIEDEIMLELKDINGYLNIGRQTAESKREVYFACKDFRLPSKVFYAIQQKYGDKLEIDYAIYKDKYWQYFEQFQSHNNI